MDRNTVVSSNVAAIGYDDESSTLEVEFTNGSIYQYFEVPAGVYAGLVAAANSGLSVGQYLDQHVKKAGYRYEKL